LRGRLAAFSNKGDTFVRRLLWSLLAVPPAVGLAVAFLASAPGPGVRTAPVHATLDARAAAAAKTALRQLVFSHPANQAVPGHTRRAPDLTQQESFDWSGYVDDNTSGKTYNKVTGNWTEPVITCGQQDQIAVFWVGLDGYTGSSTEQAGTLAQCFQGTAHYYTWWQMYPAKTSPVEVGTTVKPGDKIAALVSVTGTKYTLKVTDSTTTGNSFSTQQTCATATCPDSSAEWIAEAPYGTRGDYPLPDFKTWALTAATVTSGTTSGVISTFPDDALTMLDGTETYNLAAPGALNKTAKSFTVTWANSY
jgi:peptidase A4-like protein